MTMHDGLTIGLGLWALGALMIWPHAWQRSLPWFMDEREEEFEASTLLLALTWPAVVVGAVLIVVVVLIMDQLTTIGRFLGAWWTGPWA